MVIEQLQNLICQDFDEKKKRQTFKTCNNNNNDSFVKFVNENRDRSKVITRDIPPDSILYVVHSSILQLLTLQPETHLRTDPNMVSILSSKLSPHGVQDWQSSTFKCHVPSSHIGLVPSLHLGRVRL